jgi:phosphoserine aminotransferase
VAEPAHWRSNTSVCLKIVDPEVAALDEAAQRDFVKRMARLLEAEGVAYDIAGHRDAPPGLRVWCGTTVETADVERLTPVARLGLRGGEGRLRFRFPKDRQGPQAPGEGI